MMIWVICKYVGLCNISWECEILVKIQQLRTSRDSMECKCQHRNLSVVKISQMIDQNKDFNYHNFL